MGKRKVKKDRKLEKNVSISESEVDLDLSIPKSPAKKSRKREPVTPEVSPSSSHKLSLNSPKFESLEPIDLDSPKASSSKSPGKSKKKHKKKRSVHEPDEPQLQVESNGTPKKSKKVKAERPKSPSSPERELEPEPEVETGIDLTAIPIVDLRRLVTNVKNECPETDNLTAKTRLRKLPWNKIAFDNYSPELCLKLWEEIQKRQRQHRILAELATDALQWLEKPWQAQDKAKSTRNHPDFPKRPRSAFLIFLAENKADIQRQNKHVKLTALSRIAGQLYNNLSKKEKDHYLERGAAYMRQYDEDVKIFYNKHPELKTEEVPKHQGPAKPLTPFAIFLQEYMDKEEHIDDKNAYRMACKETWNNMKSKKKVPYIRHALQLKEKYLEELEVYNFQHPNKTVKARPILNKEEISILDKEDGKPQKPPKSTYMYFIQKLNDEQEFSEMGAKERMKAIAVKWKELTAAEREVCDVQFKKLQAKYAEDYKVYLDKLPEEARAKEELENSKQKPKKPKAHNESKRFSKKEISSYAVPQQWSSMTEEDKKSYLSAIARVRGYFDDKINETIHEDKDGGVVDVDADSDDVGAGSASDSDSE